MNKSQENWSDTQLSLSTATPSLGGAPPKLMTLNVKSYQSSYHRGEKFYHHTRFRPAFFEKFRSEEARAYADTEYSKCLDRRIVDEKETADEENIVNVLSTTAEASMSSTSFTIPRRATIDADVSVHFSFPMRFFSSHEH